MAELALVIDALRHFVETLITTFGPGQTVLIAFGIILVVSVARIYQDKRKDREVNIALANMEKAVQRSANEAREWRIVLLKEKFNWSDAQIEHFILQAQFSDPAEARTAMEKRGGTPQSDVEPSPVKERSARKGIKKK